MIDVIGVLACNLTGKDCQFDCIIQISAGILVVCFGLCINNGSS